MNSPRSYEMLTRNSWRFLIPLLAVGLQIANIDFDAFRSGYWHFSGWDAQKYIRIAEAFRGYEPVRDALSSVPSWHAYRWLPSAVVGLLPFDIDSSFLAASLALSLITSLLLFELLLREEVPIRIVLPVFLMVTLYRYYTEYSLLVPYQLCDLMLHVSVPMVLLGMTRKNLWLVAAGCAVGTLGRQTAIMFIPFLVYCSMTRIVSWRLAFVGSAVTIVSFLFAFLISSGDIQPLLQLMTPGSGQASRWEEWVSFFGVALLSYGPVVYILAAMALLRPRDFLGVARQQSHLILLVGLIAAQPILSGPSTTGENVMRLTSFGLPAMALFTCEFMRRTALLRRGSAFLIGTAIVIEYLLGSASIAPMLTAVRPYWVMVATAVAGAAVAVLKRSGPPTAHARWPS